MRTCHRWPCWEWKDRLLGQCCHKRKVECRDGCALLAGLRTILVAPPPQVDSEGTTDMGSFNPAQRSKSAGPSAEHAWLEPPVVPREVMRPMEGITCLKVNESRSEFADKEAGKKYGIFSEIGGTCPGRYLGNSPAEEGGENGQRTIRKLFVQCLYTKWTRNWSHRTKHGCRFDKRHLPFAFIVSPIRVFSTKYSISSLAQYPPKV